MTCYELPLNERVRSLLRLEFLYRQLDHFKNRDSVWDNRATLQSMFDVLEFISRNDIRSEVIKELERYSNYLDGLRSTPGIDLPALDSFLAQIGEITRQVHAMDSQALDNIRQNEFLSAIRQRSGVPGGACDFDLPGLHYWLQTDGSVRQQTLERWLEPLRPLQQAVSLILQLIRTSVDPSDRTAENGFYQQSLDGKVAHQLIRVVIPDDQSIYPEISGSRHRFSIRFMEQGRPDKRAVPRNEHITFQLACCVL